MKKDYLLCIDDEAQVLKSLIQILILKFPDMPVYSANSGRGALELVRDLESQGLLPAVVISDLLMPEMSGDEVLHQIHTHYPWAKTILLTGQAALENLSKAVNEGGLYRYVPKPWDLQDFILTIQEAIKSYRQDRLVETQNLELRELNHTLEERVRRRTFDLQKEIDQKEKAEDAVKTLNEILKVRIRELTLINRLIHKLGTCRKFPQVPQVVQEELTPLYKDVKVILGLQTSKGRRLEILEPDQDGSRKILLADQPFISYAVDHQQTLVAGTGNEVPGFTPPLVIIPFKAEIGLSGCLFIKIVDEHPNLDTLNLFETLGAMTAGSVEMIHTLAMEMEARKAAEEANKTKSRFLANMSHEIRTPMNAVLGFTQVLLNAEDLNEEHKESLKIIQSSGHHLLSLINEVLDLSKIEAGKLVLKKRSFNIPRTVMQIQSLFELQAKDKGLDFLVGIDENLPVWVLGDDAKLGQVLINLISNSLKHTNHGEIRLDVRAGEKPGMVYFSVGDTGEGIDTEDQERVFEPFVMAESRKSTAGGTGLGLTISRKLVEAMGGRLSLQSIPGQGTVVMFYLKLPISSSTESNLETLYSRVKGADPLSPSKKVLLVDESLQNRQLLKEIFQRVHCEVWSVESGELALSMVKTWVPDMVVLEMRLPGIDGLETARQFHKMPEMEKIPLIGTSATWSSKKTGGLFDKFLFKPFKESDIYKIVETYFGMRLHFRLDSEDGSVKTSVNPLDMLTPIALRALPLHWRRGALEVLGEGDYVKLMEAVRTLEPEWEPFKRALSGLVEQKDYEKLKALLEKSL